jgi:hypothetical protein
LRLTTKLLDQVVENIGKCCRSIAPIISQLRERLKPTLGAKVNENSMLDRRFSIAPMMDCVESFSKSNS